MNEADALAAQEEHDLNAAIAASLMDSSSFAAGTSSVCDKGTSAGSPAIEDSSKSGEEVDAAAIAASLIASAFSKGPGSIQIQAMYQALPPLLAHNIISDPFGEIRTSCRRSRPNPDSCSLWTRYNGDTKTDV